MRHFIVIRWRSKKKTSWSTDKKFLHWWSSGDRSTWILPRPPTRQRIMLRLVQWIPVFRLPLNPLNKSRCSICILHTAQHREFRFSFFKSSARNDGKKTSTTSGLSWLCLWPCVKECLHNQMLVEKRVSRCGCLQVIVPRSFSSFHNLRGRLPSILVLGSWKNTTLGMTTLMRSFAELSE